MKRIALGMGLSDYYDHGIARGIVRYARSRPGWQLYGHGWMFSPLESISSWDGDGVITRIEYPESARIVSNLKCPVVDVANAVPVPGLVSVSNDDYETGRVAGRYFSANGFSTFAFCGVSAVDWSRERFDGFRAETGSAEPSLFERSLHWWMKGLYSELALFLSHLPKPVALFACNDKVGLRVSSTCAGEEIRVPEEVAILGVDNEDIPCELANPSLSSIALRLEEVGTLAATKLDEMMQGRRPDSRGVTRLTVPPGDVVERKSTSAYVSKNPLVVEVFRLIRSDGGHLKNVSDLVQELPAGRRTLEIHFRNDTGHTIYDAIVAQRIRVATRLLRTTDHTNEAIAAEAGFGSVQRLFAHFRKHTGTTPARFRRRLR